MLLSHKNLLILVSDGVEYDECVLLRNALEREGANVFLSASCPYINIETIQGGRRGPDLAIDLPFDSLPYERFDAMIIPDGYLSIVDIVDNSAVIALIKDFHRQGAPIFASGGIEQILANTIPVAECVLRRESKIIEDFVDQIVCALVDLLPRALPLNVCPIVTQ